MAVTGAVSGLTRAVAGSKRVHRGLITATGTTTDDGDAITAAALGLTVIEDLVITSPFVDSTSNPVLAYQARYNPASGKIVFFATNATPGAAVADPQITDGSTVTNYSARFQATGR